MAKKTALILSFLILFTGFSLFAQTPSSTIWKVDFSDNAAPQISVSTNFCWDIGSHLVLFSPDSSLKIKFSLPPGDYSKAKIRVMDRASSDEMVRSSLITDALYPDDVEYSPLMTNITVNDKDALYNNIVDWSFDTSHVYNAGRFLKEGDNVIIFTVNQRSIIRYEIQKIELISE